MTSKKGDGDEHSDRAYYSYSSSDYLLSAG